MNPKTLYLVRHAKSSWKDASLTDQQRPLNKRGRKNAPEMANRLKDNNVTVDLIISSPAKRARLTASYMAKGIDYDPDRIQQNDRLYFEGICAMLDIINQTDPHIQSLMLVGHNPDMSSLFNYLCGKQIWSMPTCAIATINFTNDWSDVCQEKGTVIDYDFPKKGLQ